MDEPGTATKRSSRLPGKLVTNWMRVCERKVLLTFGPGWPVTAARSMRDPASQASPPAHDITTTMPVASLHGERRIRRMMMVVAAKTRCCC